MNAQVIRNLSDYELKMAVHTCLLSLEVMPGNKDAAAELEALDAEELRRILLAKPLTAQPTE